MCGQTHGQTRSPCAAPSWQFELRLWGISNGFSFNQPFDLLGSQSTFGRSQDSSMCAHVSLNQDGFHGKGVWVGNSPWHDSLLTCKEPFRCTCGRGGLPTSGIRNMWSSSLVVLLFLSQSFIPEGMNVQLLYPGWGLGGGACSPASWSPSFLPCSILSVLPASSLPSFSANLLSELQLSSCHPTSNTTIYLLCLRYEVWTFWNSKGTILYLTLVFLLYSLPLPLVQFKWPFVASLVAQLVKNSLAVWETWVRFLGWEDPLEKGRTTHSSILAWRIPWTVQSMVSQRGLSDFPFHTWALYLADSALSSNVVSGKPFWPRQPEISVPLAHKAPLLTLDCNALDTVLWSSASDFSTSQSTSPGEEQCFIHSFSPGVCSSKRLSCQLVA